mmetsp:Transcript_33460/g.77102  ORF Transcript_33460/g.77102 Transcript_33460/m.77102 type:complete len:167 (+) Transcript_33460:201-701(+)
MTRQMMEWKAMVTMMVIAMLWVGSSAYLVAPTPAMRHAVSKVGRSIRLQAFSQPSEDWSFEWPNVNMNSLWTYEAQPLVKASYNEYVVTKESAQNLKLFLTMFSLVPRSAPLEFTFAAPGSDWIVRAQETSSWDPTNSPQRKNLPKKNPLRRVARWVLRRPRPQTE